MAKATISDLTGKLVDDDNHVRIVVLSHPSLDGPVELDGGYSEVENIQATTDSFVMLRLHTTGGSSDQIVLSLAEFDALCDGKTDEVLKRARPAKSDGGGSARRDPAYLAQVRAWANANGHSVSSKGRIAAEIEAAYHQAMAA